MMSELPPSERPAAAPRRKGTSTLVFAVVLILIGVYLLFDNLGLLYFDFFYYLENWWALFLLIPAVAMLRSAWVAYQESGHQFTRMASRQLLGALALMVITVILLFDLDWGDYWPLFLIIAGVGVLIGKVAEE
ncbi:MAG TPA: hypothetical protein ENI95_08960 [Chloroflexi bacterium]|nr:hypothetical protein [Chloroflexota bacterium]